MRPSRITVLVVGALPATNAWDFPTLWLILVLAAGLALRSEGAGWGRSLATLVVWGGALRTVIVWHTTWSVNSVTHIWGYRNYATPDGSRNNPVIGFIAGGEGWHNNHHADPASARHGHHWWEVDFTWWMIRILMRLGLATKVSLPSPNLGAKFAPAPMSRPVPDLNR